MRIIAKLDAEEALKTLGNMLSALKNRKPLLRIIGRIVVDSVNRNFEAGGRPERWKPSRRHLGVAMQRVGGGSYRKGVAPSARAVEKFGQTLVDTGRLVKSITSQVIDDSKVAIGTNVVYGAVHQFGAKKGQFGRQYVPVSQHKRMTAAGYRVVRPHLRRQQIPWGDIPARPFLLIQDEDWAEMRTAATNHIFGGKK